MTAIRGSDDKSETDATILERANRVLNLGYTPDWTPRERADVLEAFRSALRDLPLWAIKRAFAEWERTMPRRPSPADIRILAGRQMQPITDEIARRRRDEEEREAEARRRPTVSKAAADAILHSAGFDPDRSDLVKRFPQARSIEEAQARRDAPQRAAHWSETAAPDSPEMDALRRARERNDLVTTARADAERLAAKKSKA